MDPELLAKNKRNGPKAYFLDEVKRVRKLQNQMKNKHYTLRQALKRVSNSLILNPTMTISDIKSNNFESLLKKDKEIYKEFRNKTRIKGKFTSFDYTKLKFDGFYTVNDTNAAVYFYEDLVIIEYKSPQVGTGASIEIMTNEDFNENIGINTFYVSDKSPKGAKY
mgnify:CR=1 FL=1